MTDYEHDDEGEVPEGVDFVITSMPHDQFERETRRRLQEAVDDDEPQDHVHNFEDPKKVQKLFAPSRLDLLVALLEDDYESINRLAQAVDRDYKDVYEDLQLLSDYGIVRFDHTSPGRAKKPYVPYENVRVEVEVGRTKPDA